MMGSQFILSVNAYRSCHSAFSCSTWLMPSPLALPLNDSSRMGVTLTLASSCSSGVIFSKRGHTCQAKALNSFSWRVLAISTISSLEKGMAAQTPGLRPNFRSVFARIFGMGPTAMQPPQPVPARVLSRMAWKLSAPSLIALSMIHFCTEWQLHTLSVAARFVPSPPSSTLGEAPAMMSSGVRPPRSGFFEMVASLGKSIAGAPTRMPPRSFLPSGEKTSFL
mmetsp:Transcript_94355/g.243674  ORF Transcript_94355/g.243674 Transcript_94355/m.243674 type:complete len:222 (+) Transcript_94355:476-1141(+)